MSYTREVTVWCDRCGTWGRGNTPKVGEARRSLRKKGWAHIKDPEAREAGWSTACMIDLCPECAKKIKGGAQSQRRHLRQSGP